MTVKAPDIPCPRLDDEDYMKVWHKFLRADIERMHMESQRDTWRKAFYVVAAILFLLMLTLLVMCGSKLTSSILLSLGHLQASLDGPLLRAAFFILHSSLFT